MRIKKLHIQNFKSLVDFQLEDIPQFCAFVGPNASGKSNIFEALEFSNYFSIFSLEAVSLFGYLSDIISYKKALTANRDLQFLLIFDDEIKIEYKLNVEITKNSDFVVNAIGLSNKPIPNGIDYPTILTIRDKFIRTEFLAKWATIKKTKYEQDYEIFIDNFSRIFVGKQELRKFNQSSNKLLIDASNIAQILFRIFLDDTKREDFMEWLRILVPEFERIDVQKSSIDGSFHIFVYEKSHSKPFPVTLLSDGTKNILALMAAVYQSNEPQFLCIEEPENGLHPQAIEQLIELFRIKCEEERHHIWLNTHSQTLVRSLQTEEIILVNKINGETKAKQLTKKDDYGMKTDEAWLTNFFGGGVL